MMKLYSSPTSPFVRKIRILIAELGITDSVALVETSVWDPQSDHRTRAPLGKIPILELESGEFIFDSALICAYLDDKFGTMDHHGDHRDGSWVHIGNWQVIGDGICNAAVLYFLEIARREEPMRAQWWIDRQLASVDASIQWAEQRADDLATDKFSIGEIAMVSALGYVDLRIPASEWQSKAPKLAKWYAAISARPSVTSTAAPTS